MKKQLDIEQDILNLIYENKPITCVHIYERVPDSTDDNPKYRSIEKFSISVELSGKMNFNFNFINSPWDHIVTLKKKSKHATKSVVLTTSPVDSEIRYGKLVKRKHGVSYKKATIRLYFDSLVKYADGTHRYLKEDV